jgi:CO/xanthine dehydrogenase FAD-binding subunit
VKPFAYVNAGSQQEALAALSTATRGKILPLAGGMDLIGLMKDYVVTPDVLVNVKKLPSAVAVPAQGLTSIGAAATLPTTPRSSRPTRRSPTPPADWARRRSGTSAPSAAT